MNFKKQLEQNKIITSVEEVSFLEVLNTISDSILVKTIKKRLALVEVYKFVYMVNRKKIVGYVSIPKKGNTFPCLIHLRGGSRDFGMLQPSVILRDMVRFSVEGYVVISTQYPGVEGGEGVDMFGGEEDIASIVKLKDILKGIDVCDLKKIGIKGHSRGGLMTYMILAKAKWIQAAIIASAPTDQIQQAKERKGWREHQIKMWGASRGESLRRSPLRWADKLPKKIPLLILHGSADWRVSPLHSIDMSRELYIQKIPHRFVFLEGADHSLTEYREEYFRQSIEWFNRFLKQGEALPNVNVHGK